MQEAGGLSETLLSSASSRGPAAAGEEGGGRQSCRFCRCSHSLTERGASQQGRVCRGREKAGPTQPSSPAWPRQERAAVTRNKRQDDAGWRPGDASFARGPSVDACCVRTGSAPGRQQPLKLTVHSRGSWGPTKHLLPNKPSLAVSEPGSRHCRAHVSARCSFAPVQVTTDTVLRGKHTRDSSLPWTCVQLPALQLLS